MRIIALALLCMLMPLAAAAKVQEVKTDGLTAWMVEAHEVPTFTLKLSFTRAGSSLDPQGREGLARLVASTLTEGAGDLDALAFSKALEDKAIRLRVSAGEDTMVVTMQSLSEHRDEALRLLTLMLTKPRFDADALARAKKETIAAIRVRQQQPEAVADEAWRALAWPNHPYGRPALGTEVSVEAVTPQDLSAFYRSHAALDHLLIAVAGDLTPAQIAAFMKGLQDSLPPTLTAGLEQSVADITVAPGIQKHIARDIPQTVVAFGFQGIKRTDPRYYAAHMLNHILGGGELDTRLMVGLRGKKGLVYYVSTDLDDLAHAQAWRGSLAAEGDKAPQALAIVRESLKAAADKGVTAEEIDDAKRLITGSFPLHISTNGALAGFLISMQYYHLGSDYLEKRNAYMNAVTLKQVNDVAGDLLAGRNPVVVTVGKDTAQ